MLFSSILSDSLLDNILISSCLSILRILHLFLIIPIIIQLITRNIFIILWNLYNIDRNILLMKWESNLISVVMSWKVVFISFLYFIVRFVLICSLFFISRFVRIVFLVIFYGFFGGNLRRFRVGFFSGVVLRLSISGLRFICSIN